MNVEIPEKLSFLLTKAASYKIIYGGRDGIKSWSVARCLAWIAAAYPVRVLCARETQASIKQSVHQLLTDQIELLGLSGQFDIMEREIRGANGSEFTFAGLKHNVQNIKSIESIDILWVEEAQTVSDDSWRTLLPTIRKENAEVWITFNPRFETDPTYTRFVLNPPKNSIVVHTTYLDNKWLSQRSKTEIETMREQSYHEYEHVYLGKCVSSIEGSVYGEEMKKVEAENRITVVSVDRTRKVDTYWDLGFGDSTAIWFAQALESGQVRIVDYLEDKGKTIEHYIIQCQQKGYIAGTDFLPHDGVDAIIHQRLGGGDKSRSVEQLMRAAGRDVRVSAKLLRSAGINAARTMLSSCWFDRERCAQGLLALKMYEWGPVTASGQERREPLHNHWSHGADAFRTMAVTVRYPDIKRAALPGPQYGRGGSSGWMGL